MHFRIRQRVVQLVRTVYDPVEKKPKASVVGRFNVDALEIDADLRTQLTEPEVREAEAWIAVHRRTMSLREEFAAHTLPETLKLAEAWFLKNRDSSNAPVIASTLIPVLNQFRKTLRDIQL